MMHRAGGGFGSNKHVEKPQPQTRPRSQAVNPAAVAQIGAQTAYPKDKLFEGRALGPQGPTNNLISGPGGGRTVYRSGGQHGLKQPTAMPAGRDALNQE